MNGKNANKIKTNGIEEINLKINVMWPVCVMMQNSKIARS